MKRILKINPRLGHTSLETLEQLSLNELKEISERLKELYREQIRILTLF